jgi:hypothetical protein
MELFKPIRCGGNNETPYLRKYLPKIKADKSRLLVDLGCGNLRNTRFAQSLGYTNTLSFDKANDFVGVKKLDLGCERIPVRTNGASIILCNYLVCFLDTKERKHLYSEITRIAAKGCYLFMEMFPAKQGTEYDTNQIRNSFVGWKTIRLSKDRFILQKD